MKPSNYATKLTQTGERDYINRKPYRTKSQKLSARTMARKQLDGSWRSPAPRSIHTGASR